ncbi:Inactive protein restricted tev movement [Thalictrum thalictroides]|uniref:Inactive protein restricted tev movement n=1 Tax=Thalictrum thalictroides TaxID=46969 RepID=A0A7J6VS08_THATH|nr:Inactive protein restricted tev movement [Thalictrum thalictroides]
MAATRPRMTLPRSFEDFQPSSNLIQEEECETLILDLPGFRKDQLRVQMDDHSNMLIISGERPIATNKWNRFRKDLHVPINCSTNEIQAKFENGVLRVIMPLKTFGKKQDQLIQNPKPVPTLPPPPPPPSQKLVTEPKPTSALSPPSQKPITEPKPTSTLPPSSQKPIVQPKLPTLQPPSSQNVFTGQKLPTLQPPPPPTHKSTIEPKLPTPQPPASQKLIADEPKPVGEAESIQTPLRPRKALIAQARKDGEIRENLVPEQTRHPLDPKFAPIPQGPMSPKPKIAPTSVEVPLIQKPNIDLNDTPTDPKSALRQKIGIKSKYDIGQDDTTNQNHKEKENRGALELKDDIKENVSSHHSVEASKIGAKRVAMELDDDSKQSIINMVAAVLVVVALWVYIKYTIKSPW